MAADDRHVGHDVDMLRPARIARSDSHSGSKVSLNRPDRAALAANACTAVDDARGGENAREQRSILGSATARMTLAVTEVHEGFDTATTNACIPEKQKSVLSETRATTARAPAVTASQLKTARDERLHRSAFLSHELHPLFARDRFCQATPYDAMLPAVKLASRFLRTPQAVYFLHAVFFGVNRGVSGDARDREEFHPSKPMHELTSHDHEAVWDQLALMAEETRFVVRDFSPRLKDLEGQTLVRPCSHINSLSRAASLVTLNGQLISELVSHDNVNNDFWAVGMFRLAVLLIHETAHATQAWAMGVEREAEYFQDSFGGEVGYELERQIFGGTVVLPPTGQAYVVRWPAQMHTMAMRLMRNVDKMGPVKSWPVDKDYVMSLQTETFWLLAMKYPQDVVPRSVQAWIRVCELSDTPSGVPSTLELLCQPGGFQSRANRAPLASIDTTELIERRAVHQLPIAQCCVRRIAQFEKWAIGDRPATTWDDISRWRGCLWWLRPPEEQVAMRARDATLGLLKIPLKGLVPAWEWNEFSRYHLQPDVTWPVDHTPKWFCPCGCMIPRVDARANDRQTCDTAMEGSPAGQDCFRNSETLRHRE